MNRLQEILTLLQEECGEVIQASTKVVRFGASPNNKRQLINELGDLLGAVKMLYEEMEFDADDLLRRADMKIVKAESYMNNVKPKRQRHE